MLARPPRFRCHVCRQAAALANAEFGPFQGAREALRAERFKKIVHGVGIEGAHGVLVVGGDEDDRRTGVDQLQNLESVQLGHLNVQEHDIRRGFRNSLHGLEAVGAFGRNFDFRVGTEHFPKETARQRFVIDDYGP